MVFVQNVAEGPGPLVAFIDRRGVLCWLTAGKLSQDGKTNSRKRKSICGKHFCIVASETMKGPLAKSR